MEKRQIAIVGGGPAGLSAAFHLTLEPDWKDKYDVTLYQHGWRLGGKAATGRDDTKGWRIEEHGIHGFCSFYYNAWWMMRSVFEEIGKHSNKSDFLVDTIDKSFLGTSARYPVENVDGAWRDSEPRYLPYTKGKPWDDPRIDQGLPTGWPLWRGILSRLVGEMLRRGRRVDVADLPNANFEDLVPKHLGGPKFSAHALKIDEALKKLYGYLQRDSKDGNADVAQRIEDLKLEEQIESIEELLHCGIEIDDIEKKARTMLARISSKFGGGKAKFFDLLMASAPTAFRDAAISLDLSLALVRGLIEGKFWEKDLDEIDQHDYRAWLALHKAKQQTLNSALVLGVANIVFAFPDGDSTRPPRLSAASWLGWTLRSLLGQGEYYWTMTAGTGESVMLPLYRVLKDRGVRFKFFHQLLELTSEPGAAGAAKVKTLRFLRQATPNSVTGDYDPLETCPHERNGKKWKFWPNHPRWSELRDGSKKKASGIDFEDWDGPRASDAQEITLEVGKEFDYVVWALPPSMIPLIIDDKLLLERWRDAHEHVTTTATQAVQLWLNKSTQDLGWDTNLEPKSARYAAATFPNPLNGMVAFDDLIDYESWGKEDPPKGLIYLTSQLQVLPEKQTRVEQKMRVLQAASASLRVMGNFLKKARPKEEKNRTDPQSIDFDCLYDPTNGGNNHGEKRLAYQYVRANTRPTEAYVQAPPKSAPKRPRAWSNGYANLVPAGDWVYTGINIGSFEGAVTGGKLAAFALSGSPQVKRIVGYELAHPKAMQEALDAVKRKVVPMMPDVTEKQR